MKKTADVIELLRDDEQYYRGVGLNYMSNSDIYNLLNNPKLFKVPQPDGKAFAEGRYFHQLLIEPEKAKLVRYANASSRNTNIYKDYLATNGVEFSMLKIEAENIESLAQTMKGNIQFFEDIYRDGNQYEVPAIGEIHGMMFKGKSDILGHDFIIDLKTTSDIKKFKWSARNYNYDSQAYIYQTLFGRPLVFYVIDKDTQQLGIFRPTQEFVDQGEQKVIRAIEVFSKYFGANPTDDIDNYYIEETL
jgi:hypothetical protein